MAQTNFNIRMDENTKKEFNAFCNEIGISVSSAFNMFAKTVVREHRIPFEITTDVPNAETVATIEKADRGEDLYGPFNTVDELMESLNA
ncbi:MAG: type II toxin-antitoxin system RelB/DinJ family antitoxin [Eubacterium sp.]|nr:type II toxin-antitoxin system RelB/DinJ family antitoxin [Eubacterium sp.]